MPKKKKKKSPKPSPEYRRGDVVWWWSDVGGYQNRTKAMFVEYDEKGFPDLYCILAIKIGNFKQRFRWPLRGIEKVK